MGKRNPATGQLRTNLGYPKPPVAKPHAALERPSAPAPIILGTTPDDLRRKQELEEVPKPLFEERPLHFREPRY